MPRYVKLLTISWSASTVSSPDERCYACFGSSCSVADPDRVRCLAHAQGVDRAGGLDEMNERWLDEPSGQRRHDAVCTRRARCCRGEPLGRGHEPRIARLP